ncbi:MAG: YARHG domain-containing protein [Myxococcales bacterium]|nr:YARHG domain-containing protein [Myxococcales bacterium]
MRSWRKVGVATLFVAMPAWAQPPPTPTTPPVVGLTYSPAFYFDRALTPADLEGRTLRELSLMRNVIFARAGNTFRRKWLDTYFRAQPWYKAQGKADASKISKLDWQNAKLIATYEAALTPEVLKKRAEAYQAKMAEGDVTPEMQIEMHLLSQRLGRWLGDQAAPETDRSPLEDPRLLDKQLTKAQLENMSRRDLRILRNMVFARRGYAFKSDLLREYFAATDWYQIDPKYTTAKLTPLDWRNVKLIRSVEDEVGGPLTDEQHQKEEYGDDHWMFAA